MKISIDSYKLPKIDGEENYEKRHRIEELRNNYLPKHRSRIESRNLAKLHAKPYPAPPKDSRATTLLNSAKGVLGDVKESFTEGLWEDYNLYSGARIASGLNSAKKGATKISGFVGRAADAVADGIVSTGVRAKPGSVPYTQRDARKAYLNPLNPSGFGYGSPSTYAQNENTRAGEDLAILQRLHGPRAGRAMFKNGENVPRGGGR